MDNYVSNSQVDAFHEFSYDLQLTLPVQTMKKGFKIGEYALDLVQSRSLLVDRRALLKSMVPLLTQLHNAIPYSIYRHIRNCQSLFQLNDVSVTLGNPLVNLGETLHSIESWRECFQLQTQLLQKCWKQPMLPQLRPA